MPTSLYRAFGLRFKQYLSLKYKNLKIEYKIFPLFSTHASFYSNCVYLCFGIISKEQFTTFKRLTCVDSNMVFCVRGAWQKVISDFAEGRCIDCMVNEFWGKRPNMSLVERLLHSPSNLFALCAGYFLNTMKIINFLPPSFRFLFMKKILIFFRRITFCTLHSNSNLVVEYTADFFKIMK